MQTFARFKAVSEHDLSKMCMSIFVNWICISRLNYSVYFRHFLEDL